MRSEQQAPQATNRSVSPRRSLDRSPGDASRQQGTLEDRGRAAALPMRMDTTPAAISNRLTHDDLAWIAQRIHQYREDLLRHPSWRCRLEDAIDVLLWSASVDERVGDLVRKDGLVPAGRRLRESHFRNVPHTAKA